MTRNPKYLTKNDSVEEAIALFNSHRIGCIPVFDENHQPIGIVTRGDIIRHFYKIKDQVIQPT